MSISDHLPFFSFLSLQMIENFKIFDTLTSLPPVVKCHILQLVLDNCFKKEHREKQSLLLTHLAGFLLFGHGAIAYLGRTHGVALE